MSQVMELVSAVNRVNDRVSAVEKVITNMSSARDSATDVLRKALGASSSNPSNYAAASGFDGSTLNLIRLGSPNQKAIGMGEFLQTVYESGQPTSDQAVIQKRLERLGSKPINKTALAEGSGATGGYTVPVQYYTQMLRLLAEKSFIRALCHTVPMTSRTLLVPALDQSGTPAAGTSAFFGGISATWTPEATAATETEPTWRNVELTARDLVFTTVASNQLLADNAVALDSLLTTLFQEAMAWFSDYYILRGNGASQPLGVINAAATYSVTRATASKFKMVDAAEMYARVLPTSQDSMVWVMHPSVIPELINMTNGATNSPFLVYMNPAPQAEGGPLVQKLPMRLLGAPVYISEKVPALGTKGDVTLVDLSKQLVGDRMQLQIETSPHVYFTKNQMVWRVIARWDSQPWLNAPIKAADGSYQMSNAVVLN